jgi:hypothetical protein
VPNIPCDLDKNFGRAAEASSERAKRKASPVLLTISVVAFGYAALHVLGWF